MKLGTTSSLGLRYSHWYCAVPSTVIALNAKDPSTSSWDPVSHLSKASFHPAIQPLFQLEWMAARGLRETQSIENGPIRLALHQA
jgi:hypothetical protein